MRHLTSLRTRTPLRVFYCACLPLLLTTFFNPARAQDLDDVTITGRVTDERGDVLPGALVTAALAETRSARTTLADAEGRYRLIELRPGAYTLRAESAGFAAGEHRVVVAAAGRSVRLDFALRPAGPAAESVVVSEGEAPPVDTARVVVGGTITRADVESLPSPTRSPLDLIFTLPGITEEPLSVRDAAEDRDPSGRAAPSARTPEESGTFTLSGGPAYSNNLTVDGLDNNDDRAARERFQPSLEAVEEVQVITNQFSAEYGRASGGRVNLRTRSGAGRLRGRLFYFFEDEALNANTWNNNRRGLGRLPLQRHAPGFTLGGPVAAPRKLFATPDPQRRARSHFFVAYEFDITLDSALVDTLVPVEHSALFPLPAPNAPGRSRREPSATPPNRPAELAPFVESVSTPARNHTLTVRLDRHFTDAHNGTLLLQLGRLRNLRQFGGGLRLADALQGRTRDTESVSYTHNSVLTPTLVNQLRAQVSGLRPAFEPRGGAGGPVVLISINDPLDDSDPSDRSGTLVAGSSTSGATDRRETRFQIQNTLTVLRGAHSVKLGVDLQRVGSTFNDLADATGTYSFTSAGDFLAAAPSRFRQSFNTESTQKNLYASLFAQDEWRPLANLSLTLGLRYERESIVDDADNFAPRAAVAYDPFGTGRTVVRLGAGVFFNRALLRTIDDFTLGRQTVEFDTNDLPTAARRSFIAAHLRFPDPLAADSPLVRDFGRTHTDFSRRLDPRLKIPESYQANVGFERELVRGFVFEANYTFNRGARLWREFNANAPRLPPGFADFAGYLLSRDFVNFRDAAGSRPVYDAQAAGDLVRFTDAAHDPANPDASARLVEFGVPVTVFNLNSVGSTAALEAALAALQPLRPDPTRAQVEQLVSAGNSFYHGLTVEARRRHASHAGGLGLSLRAAYTLSRLVDDGVVNTSSALRAGDFRAERARSLLDRRHRLVVSGTLDAPRALGALRLSPVLRVASGAPFNVSLGGADRNLDDVGNDRPDFSGDPGLIRWRRPGEPLDARLLEAFRLPTLGRAGDLPRNAGHGPGLFTFDLSITREFRLGEHTRLRPVVEIGNVLNATVYTFAAEFINFTGLRQAATPEQRRVFLEDFLVPTRTLRQRSVRLGVRVDF